MPDETPQPGAAPAGPIVTLCPYLGSRESGGEPHCYASSHNVCHARPGRGRSHSRVDRREQLRCCLEPAGGWPCCRGFLSAMAHGIQPLRTLPGEIGVGRRVRSGRRKSSAWRRFRHWVAKRFMAALAGAFVLLVSALLGLMVARAVSALW